MGMVAKKALNVADDRQASLKASVKVPLVPPFSCLLDGIQASASCTIGNRRLTIENSEEICATFAKQNDIGMVKIKLKPEMAKELEKRRSEDALTENFALELVRAPENRLFHVEIE
jgi:formylmethanofuran dehydrogenase subunit E